jgi:hypothetical protein
VFAEKRVVFIAAVVLVVCALLVCNAVPAKEAKPRSTTATVTPAKTPTALAIAAPSSAQVNQSFSITGILTANGAPLTKQTVSLQRLRGTTWTTLASQTVTGTYSFSRTETTANTYKYRTTYAGSAPYVSPTSPTATVTVTAADQTPTATPTATQNSTSLQESVFTITVTNYTLAVNQSYTVYGSLLDGLTGAPLANQPFKFYVLAPGGQQTIVDTWATTDANGNYSFTRSESARGSYWLQVAFYGNSNYSWSSQMLYINVGDPIPTTIQSLNVTNSNPAIGQPFTISGYLTDINGTPLPGRIIWVNIRLPNGDWDMTPNTTAGSNGYFSMTFSEQSAGLYRFECHFYGDNTYAQCGPAVEVTVGTIQPAKISMSTSIDNPAVNQPFTLSGYLTDANGAPLSGKEILLSRIVVGQPMPMGPFDDIYTHQNGYYSFVLSENASGSYQYMANFYGDQVYASCYVWMPITVGTLTPTQLTVTSSTTTPAVNQSFTLSGTLTANGAPLSGKTVWLSIEDPSGHWSTVDNTTTDAKGAYTFTRRVSGQGTYLFNPTFEADNTYARASAWVSITAGTPA